MVIARGKLHAIHVASKTGVYKAGSGIICLYIDERSLSDNVLRLAELGSGRVLMPSLFRMNAVLVKDTD